MWKRWLLGTLVVVLLSILVGYEENYLGEPVSERNLARITLGMTAREVEAILGRGQFESTFPATRHTDRKEQAMEWRGDEYAIVVLFDEQHRVIHKRGLTKTPRWKCPRLGWGERVCRFVRLESGPPRYCRQFTAPPSHSCPR